ncbi:MAG: hypothetical protein RMN51_13145 [Verrucomicrobiota bacterium]|nr:hypothetical protein [Limisphaera sp.]MDW8383041.1 hypothetical protein [Verrucomicrobiota bacterium]
MANQICFSKYSPDYRLLKSPTVMRSHLHGGTPPHGFLPRLLRTMFLVAGASLGTGSAQDALQTAVQLDRSYEQRTTGRFLPPEEGLRTGPVTYSISLGYGVEWNDNIFYRKRDRESDWIHSPQASVRAVWQATKDSVLSAGVGLGYRKYLDHSGLDRFYVAPDTALFYDLPVRDWVITLFEQASYSTDVLSQGALSGQAEFPRFENTVGFRALWLPDRYVLGFGYAHYNFVSDGDRFSYLDRASEQGFVRLGYRWAELSQAGVEISGAWTRFSSDLRGDNRNFSVGPYVIWQLTEATDFSVRGGYTFYEFDADAFNPRERSLDSWYLSGEARNRLTDHIQQAFSIARVVTQGLNRGNRFFSDFLESLTASYRVQWAFHEQGTAGFDAFYEHSSEPRGGQDETYDRFGVGVSSRWQFTRHFIAAVGYRFTWKDSDTNDFDYRLNLVSMQLNYRF